MNNPLRAIVQRRIEARRLLRMGGPVPGGLALEIGCGRGIGGELILDVFGADSVDAFDLDPRMVALARQRLTKRGNRVRLWTGDVTRIAVAEATYDAVFDFGVIHHVPRWRDALVEVARVLRPGGRLYAEEPLSSVIDNPIVRLLSDHPDRDQFDHEEFTRGLRSAGLTLVESQELWHCFSWFIAEKPVRFKNMSGRIDSQGVSI